MTGRNWVSKTLREASQAEGVLVKGREVTVSLVCSGTRRMLTARGQVGEGRAGNMATCLSCRAVGFVTEFLSFILSEMGTIRRGS